MRLKGLKSKVAVIALVIALAGGGYAGYQYYMDNVKSPEVTPTQVVERYFTALQERDFESAYAMVSTQHYFESFNQFVDRVSMYDRKMTLNVQREEVKNNQAVVAVHIAVPMNFGPYESDSEMDLVRIKREWKIIHP